MNLKVGQLYEWSFINEHTSIVHTYVGRLITIYNPIGGTLKISTLNGLNIVAVTFRQLKHADNLRLICQYLLKEQEHENLSHVGLNSVHGMQSGEE